MTHHVIPNKISIRTVIPENSGMIVILLYGVALKRHYSIRPLSFLFWLLDMSMTRIAKSLNFGLLWQRTKCTKKLVY